LTTPPCYESVIWTIFQEHIKISGRQVCVIFLFDSNSVRVILYLNIFINVL